MVTTEPVPLTVMAPPLAQKGDPRARQFFMTTLNVKGVAAPFDDDVGPRYPKAFAVRALDA